MERISQEKLAWMKEVGMKKFKHPMKFYSKYGDLYSEEYIENTPLDELKKGYERSLPSDWTK